MILFLWRRRRGKKVQDLKTDNRRRSGASSSARFGLAAIGFNQLSLH